MFHLGLTGDVVETYQWDVVDTYHLDVLMTYHWDVVKCFIWGLFETSWRRTDGTSLLGLLKTSSRRFNKTSWRRATETPWRRSIETSLSVSFETYLQRCWNLQRNIVTTSRRRLVSGWGPIKIKKLIWCSFFQHFCSYVRSQQETFQGIGGFLEQGHYKNFVKDRWKNFPRKNFWKVFLLQNWTKYLAKVK